MDVGASPLSSPKVSLSERDSAEDVERLFREHNAALLRFIAAKLGSTQEAKEVAQDAYVRLLSLADRGAVSYLRAFLFRTAANLATDRLRQRARRRDLTVPDDPELMVFELSPERQIAGEEAINRLRAALDELPTKCREAFLLYRFDGLRCQDVAACMGIQERMVWLYVARALEYLRARVDDEPGESHRVTGL
jgi:RNA polymerase sigma factor (sigma-70 family)